MVVQSHAGRAQKRQGLCSGGWLMAFREHVNRRRASKKPLMGNDAICCHSTCMQRDLLDAEEDLAVQLVRNVVKLLVFS